MSHASSEFYVMGGTLRPDAPSYVERHADLELFDHLEAGRFCYVLTSRQMGKSSLMVHNAARLRNAGHRVAVIDLTAFGQNLTAEQWYEALLGRVGRQLGVEDELERFWDSHSSVGPWLRWISAIQHVLLQRPPTHPPNTAPAPARTRQLILFIDEIDVVRSLPFSTDEFFIGIRECYNRRAAEPEFAQLAFCLLGIASPADLLRDPKLTPFQLGQRIELTDFSPEEAQKLVPGLGKPPEQARIILSRILYWTGGHPYLTQKLCQAAATHPTLSGPAGVDRLCERHFLSPRGREEDDNLMFVREWLLRSPLPRESVLGLYWRIHQSKPVAQDPADPAQEVLRLSGITQIDRNHLRVRNRIYHRVFDQSWVLLNYPGLAKRQRRRRRFAATLKLAAVLLLIAAVWNASSSLYSSGASTWKTAVSPAREPSLARLIRPRPALAGPNQVDLGRYYTAPFTPSWNPSAPGEDLREFSPGFHTLNGTQFDARGLVIVGGSAQGRPNPTTSPPLVVSRRAQRLHVLHAADLRPWLPALNKPVGSYRITYVDGQSWEIPVRFYVHLHYWQGWVGGGNPAPEPAWEGKIPLSTKGLPPRLFVTTLTNPLPALPVRAITLTATDNVCILLLAITVDPSPSPPPEPQP